MVTEYTPNINLYKWKTTDPKQTTIDEMSNNSDKIDVKLAEFNAHKAKDASETEKGHIQLATATETTVGTDNTKAVHPVGLKVELDKKISKNQTVAWNAPTLLNGWVSDFVNVEYFKDDLGIVRIRGWVKGGATTRSTIIFYLPIGHIPMKDYTMSTTSDIANNTSVFSRVAITTDGAVRFIEGGNYASFSLDGISFKVEQ